MHGKSSKSRLSGDALINMNCKTFMPAIIAALLCALLNASAAWAEATAPGRYIVTASTLNIRLAPNTSGQAAGKLARGEEIEVLEVDNGWARISAYYDGASAGQSGAVARWVYAAHLDSSSAESVTPPVPVVVYEFDPESPVYQAIKSSDDLDRYSGLFVVVSEKLVETGTCELSDFRDIGGWWRSARHAPRAVYYTYCGGATDNHRVFVDAETGQVFR